MEILAFGGYHFVTMGNRVAALNGEVAPVDLQKENLLFNMERLKKEKATPEEAEEAFYRVINAKVRPDWVGYAFDGRLLGRHYKVTMPMRNGFGAYPIAEAKYQFYCKEDNIHVYAVLLDGHWQGSLHVPAKTDKAAFFEEFFADVIRENTIELDPDDCNGNCFFLFQSRDIRSAYPFAPAVHILSFG